MGDRVSLSIGQVHAVTGSRPRALEGADTVHLDGLVSALEKAGITGGGTVPVREIAEAIGGVTVTDDGRRTTTLAGLGDDVPMAFAEKLSADTTGMRSESPLEPAYLEKLLSS